MLAEDIFGPKPPSFASIGEQCIAKASANHDDPCLRAQKLPGDRWAGSWNEVATRTGTEHNADTKPPAHAWSVKSVWPDIYYPKPRAAGTASEATEFDLWL